MTADPRCPRLWDVSYASTVPWAEAIHTGLRRVEGRGPPRELMYVTICITYCREQFNFELPSVILARHASLFLDKLRHCDNCLIKNVMRT